MNRYYLPELGRFISEDAARSGINWYVYCANNPLAFVDPTGLDYIDFYESLKTSTPGDTGQEASDNYKESIDIEHEKGQDVTVPENTQSDNNNEKSKDPDNSKAQKEPNVGDILASLFAKIKKQQDTSLNLQLPLDRYIRTDQFGDTKNRTTPHEGVDLCAPAGDRVKAAAAGTVVSVADAKLQGGKSGGKMVGIRDSQGRTEWYVHLDNVKVSTGQSVKQGENLGDIGSFTFDPHLHFEVRIDGKPNDPEDYLTIPTPQNTGGKKYNEFLFGGKTK
jgi:murein DD-endopeptidase MepM/ murein hydrolase activator NlpD